MARDPEKIQTDRLTLRGINETDAPEIVEWRSDPDVYRYFKSPHKITVREHFHWYNNSYLFNEDRLDWMCIEKATGKKIGVFGLVREGSVAEVNYLLAPDARHKGYAGESIDRIIRYAREKWRPEKIVAEIHRDNAPSIALAERLGFVPEAARGDFVLYGIGG